MAESVANSKRVAKNTIFLYIRMLLVMAVSIYTSRVVLATLGVSDYGIYNVVGGVVGFLGFLNSSMANAVQRFLSFELGKGEKGETNRVFCSAVVAHVIISIVVVIALELVGPWFISTKMSIPADRMDVAEWVFQCSVFTVLFSFVQVPYNAIIIAKEKMGIYAYVSIIEVLAKLGIVYLLVVIPFDKLSMYAILQMVVTIAILMIYRVYCIKKFEEAHFHFIKDFRKLKEIVSFAGWNLIGEFSWAVTNQGTSIILNMFCGPVVNAAQGVSNQVNSAVSRFIANFQTALNPQIIKSYSASQFKDMVKLVSRGSRMSFFLLLFLSLPLIYEMDYILNLWLVEVPKYATIFCQLTLICSLVMIITNLLVQVIRATGNIRNYQFSTALFSLATFPLAYYALKVGMTPAIVVVIMIFVQIVVGTMRLYFVKKQVSYPIKDFITKDVRLMLTVCVLSCIVPSIIVLFFPSSFVRFVLNILLSCTCIAILSGYIGLTKEERNKAVTIIRNHIPHSLGRHH